MTVDEAKAALDAAKKALQDAAQCRDYEVADVTARHAPSIDSAKARVSSALQALREAENAATPDHEWEGKTVVRTVTKWGGPRRLRHKVGETTERGLVFTYRHGIDLGPGWSYGRPQPGEPMVRLLKKDGKPGAKTVRLDERVRRHGVGPWALETTQPGEDQ